MVNGSQRGLTDWLIQRFSAIYLFLYLTALVIFFASHSNLDYFAWQNVFRHFSVKIFTVLFVVSLLAHAWVGVWTIFTDYVKCGKLRMCLNAIVLFALMGFFFATLIILWSV